MAPELSSNWKRLQTSLKDEKKVKEARVPSERTKHSIAKRRRIEEKQNARALPGRATTGARRRMGVGSSSENNITTPNPSASLALWAEDNDISAKDLAEAYGVGLKETALQGATQDRVNEGLSDDVELGQYLAMDCEMVGVGGVDDRSVLARVSIVNFNGTQVYDSFVRPKEYVTDWRTHVSGVSSKHMLTARSFEQVQEEVAGLLNDRVLIGHAVKNDLDAMMLGHPKKDIRDTSRYSGFRKYASGKTPSLKKLAREILGVDIQGGEHSSIEDARATMLLFRKHKQGIEVEHIKRFPQRASRDDDTVKGGKKKKKNKKR